VFTYLACIYHGYHTVYIRDGLFIRIGWFFFEIWRLDDFQDGGCQINPTSWPSLLSNKHKALQSSLSSHALHNTHCRVSLTLAYTPLPSLPFRWSSEMGCYTKLASALFMAILRYGGPDGMLWYGLITIPRQCLWCCHYGRAIARVYPVYLMNVEWRQAAADPRPSQTP